MSYSITFIGKPDSIIRALQKESENLSDDSKEDFDRALPHLIGLVQLNNSIYEPILRLTVNGYSYDGYSSCMLN